MQRCEFCGSDLPVNAQFCGNCGHPLPNGIMSATDITYPPATGDPAPQTPPLFSSPSYPNIQGTGMGWEGTDATFRTSWSTVDMESVNPQFSDHKTDENEAVLPDLLLPGMLAMQGQMPASAQAPMIQGTPQVGGVPFIHGTPVVPGNAPPSVPGLAHGAGSPTSAQAPGWEAQHRPESPPHHYQAVHHPQPTPPPHELEHQHHHRHHTGPLRDHRPHTSRLHRSATVTSKTGMRLASKWLIVALTAIVIIGSGSIILVHALMPAIPPGLTITGTSVVRDGGILHLHGQGFQPGDSITLTIDNGLPISLAGQHETQDISLGTQRSANVTGLSQMFIAGALQPSSVAATNITVSSSGTFDINVTVPLSLLAGKHTIHAEDNRRSQSASLQFTVSSSELAVNPTALNFGSVETGRTVKLSVTVSNQGGTRLHWTASVDGSNTNWLTLPNSTGVIEPNGSSEAVIVTANTNGLSLGLHSAMLRIHSENGDVQIAVKLNVIPIAQSGQQAILNVPQQNLDFGQLQTGQQVQQSISIANLGNLPLKWQASSNTASATWLSLATSNGTVQTGAAPQTVQVKVNTTGLAAGSYTGTINITSNGGNATVTVKFVVTPVAIPTVTSISLASGPGTGGTAVVITGTGFTGATSVSFGQTAASNVSVKSDTQITATSPAGSGTVDVTVTNPGGTSATSSADQFTYTTVPPTWSVSPTSLDSSTCGLSAPCTVTLTEDTSSTLNIDWTASSDVVAKFNQSNGTLKPGVQQQVSISGMACSKGTFTFKASGAATPSSLTVSWSCIPPPPKGTASLGACSYTVDSGWSCPLTVSADPSNQTNWTWTASSSGVSGISITPSSGSLQPGQSATPTPTVSIPDMVCPASATITVSDPANSIALKWSCAPTLSDTVNTPTCPWNGNGWTCQVTLYLTQGSQGGLNWKSSSNIKGVIFKPASGTLYPGQTVQLTITVPNMTCPANGNFYFQGTGANKIDEPWHCPQGPG